MAGDPIQEGQLYEGRFQIEGLLGRGGMGEVWRAIDRTTQREVALKVLLEKAARKRDLVARFEREAKITGNIKSPYVCPLLDTGHTSSGEMFLVFQLIPGESLADRLKRPPLMAFDEIASIVDDLLQGLQAAHAAGVVHRDLKPGNLILTPVPGEMPRAVILAFGISKILKRERTSNEASLTTFDATLGSFAYMAPEQVRGAARADERADIYAVGAVCFRLLTGRLPFEGESATTLLVGKLGGSAPSLEQVTGMRWPALIEQFLYRALARHRDDRFPSATEALEAWRAIGERFEQARAASQPLLDRLGDDYEESARVA